VRPGEVTMAYDVEIDGSHSAVSIGVGTLSAAYVENIEHRPGVGWLADRLVELAKKWAPTRIALDGGCGPAVAALGEIREAFERAGLNADIVEPMTSAAYRAACASFLQAVVDGKVTRPEVPNDRLFIAGSVAPERRIGESSFVYDRNNSSEPIVALTSAAMARACLAEANEQPAEAIAIVL
jgi:hypothetical protein